ncbi:MULTISPECIES: hypothetical protein [unclassified Halomonas]|uniref:hypothetical protein n=1 Tax=unclassified Halomonas TaxID=2609666 RepID=UPI002076A019|nr:MULTISPECIES: hypothetical protein [unclassified Halomonas]
MTTQLWTVVKFPNGSWSYGGPVLSPEYADCEVYCIEAPGPKTAVKKAQTIRARLKRQGKPMPTQAKPHYARAKVAV